MKYCGFVGCMFLSGIFWFNGGWVDNGLNNLFVGVHFWIRMFGDRFGVFFGFHVFGDRFGVFFGFHVFGD